MKGRRVIVLVSKQSTETGTPESHGHGKDKATCMQAHIMGQH